MVGVPRVVVAWVMVTGPGMTAVTGPGMTAMTGPGMTRPRLQGPGPSTQSQVPVLRARSQYSEPGSSTRSPDPVLGAQIQDSKPRSRIPDIEIWKSRISALVCHFFDVRSQISSKGSWGEKGPRSIQSSVYTV